ncbi:related to xeroderma pigmentosum group C complementing factor (homolog to excision repair protein RAD4) [Phialocephala subalpina]|uniref:Related to xeroderma pigmentosum group C complementing factor (Homolog to excision repair protein RAD4) n=1 Tax=Phialocephala subalpina TaxID=576137 RepID=A0A1L7WHL1_9HELO|nr:related to xeroderma pigmentosum group C complementing factor (homolog to excision repair protein RAD4) [Phialocephala subalpina]
MPPKRRGRPPKNALADEKDLNAFTGFSDTTATPKKAGGRKGKGKASSSRAAVPDVYREMLAEALPAQSDIPERPLKRRKTGRRESQTAVASSAKAPDPVTEDTDEDEDIEFEDVLTPKDDDDAESDEDEFKLPAKLQQTAYRDSDDESEDEDNEWEGVDFDTLPAEAEASGDLELTLTKKAPAAEPKATTRRRKVVSKDEKVIRLQTHKMHVLCLLSHLDRRNEWVNDPETKYTLRKLLDKKTLGFLRPRTDLSQFSQTESLKKGLDQACVMWRTKFKITARGTRRSLWAENDEDLENYVLADDADTTFDKSEFREAAQKLKGSRDVGAQLFCSLLRSAEVETRLVCSLQPLSFNAGGPSMPQAPKKKARPATPESDEEEAVNTHAGNFQFGTPSTAATSSVPMNPRLRLGHPNAAGYHMPNISSAARLPPKPKPKPIHESPYPVFWVEVFDEAHQKWLPVDPLVTESIARPRDFEPPANDRENSMSYVIGFEEEGCARDVTRRYTKAYNAKTRKNRVESTPGGDKWWRRAMRLYARGYSSDADQIEDTELAAIEAREPMPKNIQDFKDHPYYALERHLRRNEVLVAPREAGKIAAGRDKNAPGGKKMESVYRRTHVKIARSADAWYRLGRDVKMGEQPVKTVAPKKRPDDDDVGDEVDERAGTNLYTEDQTEPCVIPPIVNGRVPKNSFGNIDIFVPSMVPPGGVHIPYAEAQRAARIVGVDYADALTGFEFRGRHGTAVLKGVVVAAEYREAVEAVIVGLRDEQARIEEAVRSAAVDKMWRRLLRGLRIKAHIEATYGKDDPEPEVAQHEVAEVESNASEYLDDEYGGGGFLPEDDDGGGGFFPE